MPKKLNHYFSLEGRIGRREYMITLIICYLIISSINNNDNLCQFISFLALWVSLAQATKRCHDLGHNGWWQLIPFYGLWLLFEKGQQGSNEYGEDPKKIEANTKNH